MQFEAPAINRAFLFQVYDKEDISAGAPSLPHRNVEGQIVLPRMPMGLSLVSGQPLYAALSGICRTLGRLSVHQGKTLQGKLLGCDVTHQGVPYNQVLAAMSSQVSMDLSANEGPLLPSPT